MLSEEAFSAFWSEAPHVHKWPLLFILQPSSPKLREFHKVAVGASQIVLPYRLDESRCRSLHNSLKFFTILNEILTQMGSSIGNLDSSTGSGMDILTHHAMSRFIHQLGRVLYEEFHLHAVEGMLVAVHQCPASTKPPGPGSATDSAARPRNHLLRVQHPRNPEVLSHL